MGGPKREGSRMFKPTQANLIKRRTSAEDAQYDAIALCLALLQDGIIEGDNGNMAILRQQLQSLMEDPPRLASATITLLLMTRKLANKSPGGWVFLCQNMVDSIPELA